MEKKTIRSPNSSASPSSSQTAPTSQPSQTASSSTSNVSSTTQTALTSSTTTQTLPPGKVLHIKFPPVLEKLSTIIIDWTKRMQARTSLLGEKMVISTLDEESLVEECFKAFDLAESLGRAQPSTTSEPTTGTILHIKISLSPEKLRTAIISLGRLLCKAKSSEDLLILARGYFEQLKATGMFNEVVELLTQKPHPEVSTTSTSASTSITTTMQVSPQETKKSKIATSAKDMLAVISQLRQAFSKWKANVEEIIRLDISDADLEFRAEELFRKFNMPEILKDTHGKFSNLEGKIDYKLFKLIVDELFKVEMDIVIQLSRARVIKTYLLSSLDYLAGVFSEHAKLCPPEKFFNLKFEIYSIFEYIMLNDSVTRISTVVGEEGDEFVDRFMNKFLLSYGSALIKNKIDKPDQLADPAYEQSRIADIKDCKEEGIDFDFYSPLRAVKVPAQYLLMASQRKDMVQKLKTDKIKSKDSKDSYIKHDKSYANKLSVIASFLDFFIAESPDKSCKQIFDLCESHYKLKNPQSSVYVAYDIFLRTCQMSYYFYRNDVAKSRELRNELQKRIVALRPRIKKVSTKVKDINDQACIMELHRAMTLYTLTFTTSGIEMDRFKESARDNYIPEVPQPFISPPEPYVPTAKLVRADFCEPAYRGKLKSLPVGFKAQEKKKTQRKQQKAEREEHRKKNKENPFVYTKQPFTPIDLPLEDDSEIESSGDPARKAEATVESLSSTAASSSSLPAKRSSLLKTTPAPADLDDWQKVEWRRNQKTQPSSSTKLQQERKRRQKESLPLGGYITKSSSTSVKAPPKSKWQKVIDPKRQLNENFPLLSSTTEKSPGGPSALGTALRKDASSSRLQKDQKTYQPEPKGPLYIDFEEDGYCSEDLDGELDLCSADLDQDSKKLTSRPLSTLSSQSSSASSATVAPVPQSINKNTSQLTLSSTSKSSSVLTRNYTEITGFTDEDFPPLAITKKSPSGSSARGTALLKTDSSSPQKDKEIYEPEPREALYIGGDEDSDLDEIIEAEIESFCSEQDSKEKPTSHSLLAQSSSVSSATAMPVIQSTSTSTYQLTLSPSSKPSQLLTTPSSGKTEFKQRTDEKQSAVPISTTLDLVSQNIRLATVLEDLQSTLNSERIYMQRHLDTGAAYCFQLESEVQQLRYKLWILNNNLSLEAISPEQQFAIDAAISEDDPSLLLSGISLDAEYFKTRLKQIKAGVDLRQEIVYTELLLSYALLEEELDQFENVLDSAKKNCIPLVVQTNLILEHHQLISADKIVKLANILSSTAFLAPKISLGSAHTNNYFLSLLALSLRKEISPHFLGSLAHLRLIGSSLVANPAAVNDIVRLLKNNLKLIVIDLDSDFKNHLKYFDLDSSIEKQLEQNRRNFVAFLKELILKGNVTELTLVYQNPALKDALNPYLEQLIEFAAEQFNRKCLPFLLTQSQEEVQPVELTTSSALDSKKRAGDNVADTKKTESIHESTQLQSAAAVSESFTSSKLLLSPEEENKRLRISISDTMRRINYERRQVAAWLQNVACKSKKLETILNGLTMQIYLAENQLQIRDIALRQQLMVVRPLESKPTIVSAQSVSNSDARYFDKILQEIIAIKTEPPNEEYSVYTTLLLSNSLVDSQLDRFCQVLEKHRAAPLIIEENLKITDHQITKPEKIRDLAHALSNPTLKAPKISFSGPNTNNNFLSTLAHHLQKYNSKSFIGSLIHLRFKRSFLLANENSAQDILKLLQNNPLLVLIDLDDEFSKQLKKFTIKSNIDLQLAENKKKIVVLARSLIKSKNLSELELIYKNKKLKEILKPHMEPLIAFAERVKSKKCLNFLLGIKKTQSVGDEKSFLPTTGKPIPEKSEIETSEYKSKAVRLPDTFRTYTPPGSPIHTTKPKALSKGEKTALSEASLPKQEEVPSSRSM